MALTNFYIGAVVKKLEIILSCPRKTSSGKIVSIALSALILASVLPAMATLQHVAASPGNGISENFAFVSNIPIYDEMYALAKREVAQNIYHDSAGNILYFFAGASWAQAWTRDTSYSTQLGAGLIQPAACKITLQYCKTIVNGKELVLQDVCGHFGGWPYLTDAIVWTTGAWELYKITGDTTFLSWAYVVTKNSLENAENFVFDPADGLFRGCSSFMESNSAYPVEYEGNGPKVGQCKVLSTNLLYYNAYKICAKMATALGESPDIWEAKAENLANAIDSNLWMENQGYYAYYKDAVGVLNEHMEGLGEALAILYGVADEAKIQTIFANVYETTYGIPCQWPQYPEWMDYTSGDADYYHNGCVWPFVQGYWAWAASKENNADIFMNELENLAWLASQGDTFREFYRPEHGTPDGSVRQLWSASGYLSMIYHGLFGMDFEEDCIRFDPLVPAAFGTISLKNVQYRDMVLDITVHGPGTSIENFYLDGESETDPIVPASLTGSHTVEIYLSGYEPPDNITTDNLEVPPTTTTSTTPTSTTTAPPTTTTTTPTTTTTTTTPPAEAPWAWIGVGIAIIVIIAVMVLVLKRKGK